jgi:hypothetical protein
MSKVPPMQRAEAVQRKKELKEHAEINNPEYAGRWDSQDWVVVEILDDIMINNNYIFWEGETTIAKLFKKGNKQSWCMYCSNTGKDEILSLDKATPVRIQK